MVRTEDQPHREAEVPHSPVNPVPDNIPQQMFGEGCKHKPRCGDTSMETAYFGLLGKIEWVCS